MSKGRNVLGTILIIDGVSTNRIMLKVQLSAAWYHVIQTDRLDGVRDLIRRTRPDLIIAAHILPDGSVIDLARMLRDDPAAAALPIIAVTAQNDRHSRLAALAAGIDDVLGQPVDDLLLLARIRSLLRLRSGAEDLQRVGGAESFMTDVGPADGAGFADAAPGFAGPVTHAHVALVAAQAATATLWKSRLGPHVPHRLTAVRPGCVQALMSGPVPDAVVIELAETGEDGGDVGLRLLADLRARGGRDAVVIAVLDPAGSRRAAEALDRGADDVMTTGFSAEELGLRLATQLRRKQRRDRLQDSLRDGLRAAVRDPLTGLYNRRHALPFLARVAGEATRSGECFAVMLADLDHFKRVNDRFGHPAGDAVLAEAAQRMKAALGPCGMIARIGGEEFLAVLPATNARAASDIANRLRLGIGGRAFAIADTGERIDMTASIGVATGPDPDPGGSDPATLIRLADRALYEAKGAGRNRTCLAAPRPDAGCAAQATATP